MKKLFLICFAMILPALARADQNWIGISTVTYCDVCVATGTPTRLDNFNGISSCDGILAGRNELRLCNPTSGTTINFGFSAAVTTIPANGNLLGEELVGGACKDLSVFQTVSVYGTQSGNAGACQNIQLQQARPIRALGDNP